MRPSTSDLARRITSSWGRGSTKSVRIRQIECHDAVRQVMRSRQMATQLIAEAERDGVISSEQANSLLNQLTNY